MKKIIFAIVAVAVLFSACGAKKSAGGVYNTQMSKEAYYDNMAEIPAEPVYSDMSNVIGQTMGNNGVVEKVAAPEPNPQTAAQPVERKLIYTGNIYLEVENLAKARTALEAWLKKYGGYISNSSESQRNLYFTVNVPQENFFAAMEESGSLGKVDNKNINSRDVTEQFYDLQTRLDTRRILLERLQGYLSTAKDMKDLIEVESKINSVTNEIEQMQGQMNRLQKQISFSQIEVQMHLPANRDERGFVFPNIKDKASDLVSNVVSFFVSFVFVLVYIVIFGAPIVLAILLIYWITFGKIGLVRKLIDKIKK